MITRCWRRRATTVIAPALVAGVLALHAAPARADDCAPPAPATFTVFLPKLGLPPDEEGQGWSRPPVWGSHAAGDDSITVPNGRPIYALFVSGYARNGYLDEMTFYNFARHLMAQGAYVHYAWWNNLLAPYMERPLHSAQSHPGTSQDLTTFITTFTNPAQAADKALPGEDYQFVADAKLLLSAIREHNPSAMIIIVGHSMGGGSVVHLGAQADVVIDILAPIDPVGNRNYPWAGPALYQGANHFNWTRWRVTRDNFLGYKSNLVDPLHPLNGCQPTGPWLANINDADVGTLCLAEGPVIHAAPTLRFGSNVINLHHRWQNEALFPFDFASTRTFLHTVPPGGTSSQLASATRDSGADPGGLPWPPVGGICCPIGDGEGYPQDGHGEIVGFRGPVPSPWPLGVRVSTSPQCTGCFGLTWPARTLSDGTWGNPNSGTRANLLRALETRPLGSPWEHAPYNPDLCLVSAGLIAKYNTMNKPPTARAGPDQAVVCNGCAAAAVALDGSASTDPDAADTLTYRWTWNLGASPVLNEPTYNIQLPPGSHCVTLEVRDPCGHISRDTLEVTVTDPSAAVVPYASVAAAWQADAGSYEAHAFDEFFPGLANATGCLLPQPTQPAVLQLAGGRVTVSALNGAAPYCAISDAGTAPAVSDAHISSATSVVRMEFDPPVSAFYTYFGSLAVGRTATMRLFADGGAQPFASVTTPPSTHGSLAAGQGFTSTIPVQAIEFFSTENGAVLIGAFVGLRAGEQSLGTVNLGSYPGPGQPGVVELDFALTFVDTCPADWNDDDAVNSTDISAFLTAWLGSVTGGNLIADFNDDGQVNSTDISGFLTAWLGAVTGGC